MGKELPIYFKYFWHERGVGLKKATSFSIKS